jgi:serine/threonine protein kinase
MKACPQCNLKYPSDKTVCFVDGATLDDIRDPRVGTTIAGRYVIDEVIGEGGMATVYRARHNLSERAVAIKIMNPELASNAVIQERFRREAKAAQKIAHPNVIEILDQGDTGDGSLYLVMELLEGETLADVMHEGKVPLERAIPILIQIARALARAHDLEVIHRDLKPENIFLAKQTDGHEVVKLLDFGIARSMQDARLTGSGEVFGTPQYMAPERITSTDAGPSADLYALGVMTFEMVTGRLPFEAKDVATFFVKHMKEAPPTMRSIDPKVPAALDELALGMMEKEPADRPVDAHRVHADLVAIAQELKIRVPSEPHEPAVSSKTPSTSQNPAVDRWQRRTQVFEQMLARAHPKDRPAELTRLLSDVKQKVTELGQLRERSVSLQQQLEAIEGRGRDGRQRFGHAVHALGVDASRARDVAKSADSQVAALTGEVQQAAGVFQECHHAVVLWEGRSAFQQPYADLAKAYRDAASNVDTWLEAKGRLKAAEREAAERRAEVTDLEFQIQTLRTALANHEETIEQEQAQCHRSIRELGETADLLETELLELATRFCTPLRARPELGPLFTELESVAA